MPDPNKELEAFLKLYPSLKEQLEAVKKQAIEYRNRYCQIIARCGMEYDMLKQTNHFDWEE
jgi:hypothetical protein